jgi:hypothetical protein
VRLDFTERQSVSARRQFGRKSGVLEDVPNAPAGTKEYEVASAGKAPVRMWHWTGYSRKRWRGSWQNGSGVGGQART